jgi:branched-chain amino acid transport system ATP-binding protein
VLRRPKGWALVIQRLEESGSSRNSGSPKTDSLRLTTRDIAVHFAGVKAVDGVSLELQQGVIVGLIGPNGAGKTTMVNAITGFQRPSTGTVNVGGSEATTWSPQQYARAGVIRTFQSARLFGGLTTFENIEVGSLGVGRRHSVARSEAARLVDLMGLGNLSTRLARTLSYGSQRRLSVARALACAPKLMLLDEPAAGLDENETDELVALLKAIRDSEGCGLMVIEHDMRLVMQLCDRVHVLDYGQTLAEGTPVEVQTDDRVLTAYLGVANQRSRSRKAGHGD